MGKHVSLGHLSEVLTEFEYPIGRDAAIERTQDVTLSLADGEENLAEVIADSETATFESSEELYGEVMGLLPRHAVGEPYQSEGDA